MSARPAKGEPRPHPREKDAEVAVKLLGYRWARPDVRPGYTSYAELLSPNADVANYLMVVPADDADLAKCERLFSSVPPLTTNIAAAWLLVEKLRAGRWYFDLALTSDSTWLVTIGTYPPVEETTAPLAICLAALEAERLGAWKP